MSSLFDNNSSVPRAIPTMHSPQLHHFSVLPVLQPQAPQPPPVHPPDPKKRHACPTCSRPFTTSGHLARHIRVHTGERNHKCPFPGCETRCSRQDNLQQHYRIHLSPGSRRASSARGRADGKKKSSLSTSPTDTNSAQTTASAASARVAQRTGSLSHAYHAGPGALSADEPPDSPPPLARATVLPQSQSHSHSLFRRTDGHTRSNSASASSSSAGSPHSSYTSTSASPDIGSSTGVDPTTASPFMNVLGLSHERTQQQQHHQQQHQQQHHHQATSDFTYQPSPSPSMTMPVGIYQHRSLSADSYALSSTPTSHIHASSSFENLVSGGQTLPPIQSLQHSNTTFSTGLGSLGLGRVVQHPGPYPTHYDASPSTGATHATLSLPAHSTSWATTQPQDLYAHNQTAPATAPWWSNVGVGVGMGATRSYAQPFTAS